MNVTCVCPRNQGEQEFGLGGGGARNDIAGMEGWNKRAEGDDTYIWYGSSGFMAELVWFMFEGVGSTSAVEEVK